MSMLSLRRMDGKEVSLKVWVIHGNSNHGRFFQQYIEVRLFDLSATYIPSLGYPELAPKAPCLRGRSRKHVVELILLADTHFVSCLLKRYDVPTQGVSLHGKGSSPAYHASSFVKSREDIQGHQDATHARYFMSFFGSVLTDFSFLGNVPFCEKSLTSKHRQGFCLIMPPDPLEFRMQSQLLGPSGSSSSEDIIGRGQMFGNRISSLIAWMTFVAIKVPQGHREIFCLNSLP